MSAAARRASDDDAGVLAAVRRGGWWSATQELRVDEPLQQNTGETSGLRALSWYFFFFLFRAGPFLEHALVKIGSF